MNIIETVTLAAENLSRRKGRVAMTAVGVIIGTAAVVVLVSLAIGLQENATSQLYGISDLKQVQVSPSYSFDTVGPIGPGIPGQPPEVTPITDEDLAAFATIPGVAAVVPRDYAQVTMLIRSGRHTNYAGAVGVDTPDLSVFGWQAQAGTLTLERGTAVIGYSVPANFFEEGLRPGQEPSPPPDLLAGPLRMTLVKYSNDGQEVRRDVQLTIVGIIAETRGESDWSIYMPMDDVVAYNEWSMGRRVNRAVDGYQTVTVIAEDAREASAISETIKGMGFEAYTQQTTVEGINNFFLIMQVVFGGVGAIALLVAALGIANTMAMAVLERTSEIGLLKAVGATNRDVLSVFLGEAAGIGLLGGIGGVMLGWGAGQVINVVALAYLSGQAAQTGAPPPTSAVSTPLWLPLFAMVFATVIGLISGMMPALRAAALTPALALKAD